MTKYVVSGYIGFDNFGDEAIAQVLTSYLKNNGAEKITLISSNPEKTSKKYDVNSAGMLDFIRPIFESDVLISGGGSLLQDLTSLKSLLYYLAVIMTALVLNKKVVIFAQGFTPFRTRIGKFLTKFVLKRCQKITVRDEKSQQLLLDMGIKSEVIPDPVFGIETPKIEHSGVGVQLRSFPTITPEFLEALAEEVSVRFAGQKIKLISLQDSLDLPILNDFAKILQLKGEKCEIVTGLGVNDAVNVISSLEHLIGMRFHACLVGAKAGVKVLGINYDIKVETLAKQVGFPLLEISNSVVSESFNNLIHHNDEYKIPYFETFLT